MSSLRKVELYKHREEAAKQPEKIKHELAELRKEAEERKVSQKLKHNYKQQKKKKKRTDAAKSRINVIGNRKV